jgi:zinc protease
MMRSAFALFAFACASQPPPAPAPAIAPPLIEVPASEKWRSEVPGPAAVDPKRTAPSFRVETLPNGLTLMFLRIEGLPLVSMRLVTVGGSSADPIAQAGLGFLTYGALRDTATMVDKLGVELAIDVDRDLGTVEMTGVNTTAPGMVRQFAEMILRPKHDPKTLNGRRDRHAKQLEARSAPLSVVGDRLPALLFADHPYGHPSHGTAGSIAKIDPAAIKAHHAALFRPERSALIVVGEIELDPLRKLAAHHLGGWKANGPAPGANVPAAVARERSDIVLIHRENVSQAFACAGRAVGAGTEEEAALRVVNQILGGAFNSRLQLVLRETKGWTYGANSALNIFRDAGELLACTQVERSAAAEAVRTLLDEIARMSSAPPTDAEIRGAVAGLQAAIYGRETVSALSRLGAESFARNRGGDGSARLAAALGAVGADAVRAMAAEVAVRERWQIVVVADARGLQKELEQLGLGTVALSR